MTSSRVLSEPFEYGFGNKKEAARRLVVANPVEALPTTFTVMRGENVDELDALLRT